MDDLMHVFVCSLLIEGMKVLFYGTIRLLKRVYQQNCSYD